MTRILATAVFAILAAALTVRAMPGELVASSALTPPSFDIAMPAAQEHFATVASRADASGRASRTE